MTTPVIENIAANIETTIDLITTGNGFNQTLIGHRTKRIDFADLTPENGTVLIVTEDEEDRVYLLGGYGVMEIGQNFALMAVVIDSDDASASIETRIHQVDADIKKKLRADPSRGGYAIDTLIMPSVKIAEDNLSFSGITVNIKVKYRVKEDDPYTQA